MQIKFTDSKMWFRAKGKKEIDILRRFDVEVDLSSDKQMATIVIDLMKDTSTLKVVEALMAQFSAVDRGI